MDYIVYILQNNAHNKTYVGMTNNPIRRLRQHNGELKGGAKYTTANKCDGCWQYYGYITNVGKHTALSLEKQIKIYSRKMKGTPIQKRQQALTYVIDKFNTINEATGHHIEFTLL